MDSGLVIETRALTKRYGDAIVAVDDLELSVRRGEVTSSAPTLPLAPVTRTIARAPRCRGSRAPTRPCASGRGWRCFRLPARVELDRGDAPAPLATTEGEAIGAADHPGAAGVALEDVRADDMNVGGRLLAVDVDHWRTGQVLMGIQAGEQVSPLGCQGCTRDHVRLPAEQRAVVAAHGLVERRLDPIPLMVVESEEKTGDRFGDLAVHRRSASRPTPASQPRTWPTASLTYGSWS